MVEGTYGGWSALTHGLGIGQRRLIDASIRPMLAMEVIFWNCEMPRASSAVRELKKKEQIMSAAASTVSAQSMKIARVKKQIGAIVTGSTLRNPSTSRRRRSSTTPSSKTWSS